MVEALETGHAYTTLSLSAPSAAATTATTSTRSSRSASVDPEFELSEDRAVVEPGLRALDERERRILHLRFYEGLTQSQIAEQIGISQMHVSRLIRRSLEKMREELVEDEENGSGSSVARRVRSAMRTTAELREGFLAFFEAHGHMRRPSGLGDSACRRSDDALHRRRHAADEEVVPRRRAARRAARHDRAEGDARRRQAERPRRRRPHRTPRLVLRDARQLLVRRLLQGRGDRPRLGVRRPKQLGLRAGARSGRRSSPATRSSGSARTRSRSTAGTASASRASGSSGCRAPRTSGRRPTPARAGPARSSTSTAATSSAATGPTARPAATATASSSSGTSSSWSSTSPTTGR